MRLGLDKKNDFGVSQRYRLSRALSTVLVLSLIQIVAAPILAPILSPQARAANLFDNRSNFQQWTTWQGGANHVPYKTSAGTAEITSNSDSINLTQDLGGQSGFLWNTQVVSIAQDLSVSANIFLGAKDGADMAIFSMRPLNQWPNGGTTGSSSGGTSVWASGEIRAVFDTWQNPPGERVDDHLRVEAVTTGSVTSKFTGDGLLIKNASGQEITDVETNQSYPFTFRWTASSRTFAVYSGLQANHVIFERVISDTEWNTTQFAWGWVGLTGGASNYHAISDVTYHVGPTVTSSEADRTVADGASVTLSASYTSSETSPTRRWEYSTDGGSTWTSTAISDSTYTFTASRSLTQRKYRFYVASTAVGITYTAASTPMTLTVSPPSLNSETDTALNLSASNQFAKIDGTILPTASASPFTLEAWVYPADAGTNDVIFSQGTGSTRFYVKRESGVLKYFRDGFSTVASELTCGAIPTRAWTHIAVTWNGSSETNCYINASKVRTSGAALSSIKTLNGPAYIGQYSADSNLDASTAFAGQIDELKIWGSVRDQSQILTSSNSRVDTSDANLLAYYDFNEGLSSTIYNRKVNATSSSDFTIQSSGTWVSDSITATSISAPYTIQRFFRSYITANNGWKVPTSSLNVSGLVVGGGGGGGWNSGGGGSGGGFLTFNKTTISGTMKVIVGAGGKASLTNAADSTNGGSSNFGDLFTVGGGNRGLNYTTSGGVGGASVSGSGAGGKGADSASPANMNGTAGGAGPQSNVTGTLTSYSGGGGGGAYSNGGVISDGSTGGAAGVGGGGVGEGKTVSAASGSPNTGGGGGASAASNTNAGYGGSGVIIFRWITASVPSYTPPAAVDTTTAGTRYTFQMSGTAVGPLIRNYIWQFSNDTGTSWSNLQASTSDSYTTSTLETTTSGSRFKYRVIVTDSDTAGLSISDSSTFSLVIELRITISGSSFSLSQKYGETQTVTYTIANGSNNRTTTPSPNNRTGITWSSVSGSSATLGIGAGLGVGTYYETLTVTDGAAATTTQMITIAVSKADTITVTMDTITALTHTGSAALINPSVKISGLSSADTATVQYNYEGSTLSYNATSSSLSCANGGTCALGDLAPGGGRVFYISATKINAATGISDGGIYLATAPNSWWTAAGISSYDPVFISNIPCRSVAFNGTYTDTIGSGAENTRQLMTNSCAQSGGTPSDISTSTFGGYSDWFVPSMAELQVMYTNLYAAGRATVPSPGWTACSYWSSNPATASTQNVRFMTCNGLGGLASTTSKGSTTGQSVYAMPIRAFSPLPTSSSVAPTNAGNYTALPVNFTIASPSSLANYQGVTVTGRSFTINKANQARLTIGQYDAFPGVSTYPVNVYGGTGIGAVTRSLVETGTANCTLTNAMFLTATTQGTCSVRAVKSGGINYFDETTTATIYWITFRTNYANGAAGGSTGITLTGETSITKLTYETFTVLSFANGSGGAITSASVGSVLRVIGTGFNASDSTTEVFFGMTSVPASSLTFNVVDPLANYVQLTVPVDAETDRVVMRSRKGWATSPGTLTITP
ncbi:Concanavalin A-like lectin/glucanases superfamily [Candidatus Nanopelagicaceae bacterium]